MTRESMSEMHGLHRRRRPKHPNGSPLLVASNAWEKVVTRLIDANRISRD